MAYRYPEQYGSPRAVAKNSVQWLFHRVVRPGRFVEHYSVQLNPNANGADYQSPNVNDRLSRKNKNIKIVAINRRSWTFYLHRIIWNIHISIKYNIIIYPLVEFVIVVRASIHSIIVKLFLTEWYITIK